MTASAAREEEMDNNQKRLKQLDLLGGLGASILGAGIALVFVRWLPALCTGFACGGHPVAWMGHAGQEPTRTAIQHHTVSVGGGGRMDLLADDRGLDFLRHRAVPALKPKHRAGSLCAQTALQAILTVLMWIIFFSDHFP
ncbi:hypothetical protein LP419_37950 [Massilia sp. H-1]|nr:hypothetical protein LP419_37950 [Massilia sp. H-1]